MTKKSRLQGRAAERNITPEVAKEYFTYDPETGYFYAKTESKKLKASIGEVAGSKIGKGYVFITVPGFGRVYAHRLAALIMTGSWPTNIIDHINHNPEDNRWVNLREVDYSTNNHHSRVRKDSKTGVRGVRQLKSGNYEAEVRHHKQSFRLGTFETLEEASIAVVTKRIELSLSVADECMYKQ